MEDKHLRLDIAQIQESVETENIKVQWICAQKMIADCLAKKGVKTDKLMEVLENAGFDLKEDKENKERKESE